MAVVAILAAAFQVVAAYFAACFAGKDAHLWSVQDVEQDVLEDVLFAARK